MTNKDTEILDVTGLTCPLPVLRAQKRLRELKAGAVLTVHATDPVAAIDFPHFCNESGHELLASSKADNVLVFQIRVRAERSENSAASTP